jgi:hypothetical protein
VAVCVTEVLAIADRSNAGAALVARPPSEPRAFKPRQGHGYSDGDRAKMVVKSIEGKRLTYKMPSRPSAN